MFMITFLQPSRTWRKTHVRKGPKNWQAGETVGAFRVGDYRILYDIADAVRIVRIFRVRHRRDAYR